MKLLVVVRAAPGAPPVKKTVEGMIFRVGRNASCEIHLADPRIPLEQGMLFDRGGLVYVEGEGQLRAVATTRKAVRSVRLKPGEPIEIGPYRMEAIAAPAGFDAAISVELQRPVQVATKLATRASGTTLASLRISKRWASWAIVAAVLIAFVAIPAARVLDLPWKDATKTASVGDRFWNPGPVMLAHQPIEAKCDACHQVAFEHVKDGACLECHKSIGHHVGPELMPASLFAGARCSACHRDHKGVKTTHRDDDRFCVDCHVDIGARTKSAKSSNVSDFAKNHPAFRVTLPTPDGMRRVRQGEGALVEASNLKFPHATHLDPKGVRSPLQGRMKMECKTCHQPDASKRGFEPISMPKHCQECHNLQFEPAVTTREVPHGKAAEAVTVIEEFYSSLALKGTPDSFQKAFGVPGQGLLRRVGEPTGAERQAALSLATKKSTQVTRELFELRVCITCHEVGAAPEWKVEPVRPSHRWMPQASFDHKSHAQTPCADCHAVDTSKKSADVAMPIIAGCRECHGGSKPVQGKVTSNCLLCHAFHDSRFAWDPAFRPKESKRVAAH